MDHPTPSTTRPAPKAHADAPRPARKPFARPSRTWRDPLDQEHRHQRHALAKRRDDLHLADSGHY